jgi:hypothetical protein
MLYDGLRFAEALAYLKEYTARGPRQMALTAAARVGVPSRVTERIQPELPLRP